MALILLEGLDRTGKSTVAQIFKDQGYEVLHMSAPSKDFFQPGYVGPSYVDEMVELLASAATRDIVLDRSHYGELIWPTVFNRKPLLSEDDIEVLREIEDAVGVQRILMTDNNLELHWQRCVENNEPLSKSQFLKARALYERMADKYGFEKKTLKDFIDVPTKQNQADGAVSEALNKAGTSMSNADKNIQKESHDIPELQKLEKANVINDVLSKRLIKAKGPIYDELENDIRCFLREKLGKIFGESTNNDFSKDEIQLLKLFCERLKEKENKR
jgi:hypothetical protein